jgi:hypothetical protein
MHSKRVWSLLFAISLAFFMASRFAVGNPQASVTAQARTAGSPAQSPIPALAKPSATPSAPNASPVRNPEEAIESVSRQMRSEEKAPASPGALPANPTNSPGLETEAGPSLEDEEPADATMASGPRTLPFQIGDSSLSMEEKRFPGPCSLVFFAPHDDENTCVEAAIEVATLQGGRILELKSGGNRRIAFKLQGRTISVDPNRIFTEVGIRKALGSQASGNNEVVAAIGTFAGQLLKAMKARPSRLLVALHNNTNGGALEISNFAPGRSRAVEAEDYHANPALDGDDFFLTTARPIFEKLKQAGYNVVLQDNQRVPDDGSLSVYCGRQGIPYLNVEAQAGHRTEQKRMIEAVIMLDASKPIPPAVNRSTPSAPAPRPRIHTEERGSPEESPLPKVSPRDAMARAF